MIESETPVPTQTVTKGVIGKGENYETEYFIFEGPDPKPVIFINGGLHGDETASWLTADEMKKIVMKKGTLILVPRLNLPACRADKRFFNQDLNRSFPGDPKGKNYEMRLAYEITDFIGRHHPDLILSMHESKKHHKDSKKHLGGQVIYYGVDPMPENLAGAVEKINSRIENPDKKYLPVYYPVNGATSELWVETFGLEAYATETWKGYELKDRIRMHWIINKSFMDQLGMSYSIEE